MQDSAGPANGTLTVRLHRMTWEAADVLSLDFRDPDGRPLPPFAPGAHLDLHLPGGVIRQYSLCGDPADRGVYTVAVLKTPDGRGSRAVHETLRPGQLLTVGAPRNNFRFDPAARYLFIAGGIGITPLLPMVRAAAAAGAPWTLHYCVRAVSAAPFLDALATVPGGAVVLHASAAGTRLSVEAVLAEPAADTLVYCCGPERLMQAVEAAGAGWPEGSLRFEWFAPRSAAAAAAGESAELEVVCARSGTTVVVPPDRSILDALAAAGVDAPCSCEQGVCGTCETAVLEGEPDHRDSILSAAERAAGRSMMICVSRARGRRLVLDI
ncbi:PDR/VanB family oxidoreductase [Azospirillum sp. ST 5-10]|uniref:PDR/VanB family oxidoreductase n=1 Tax=unclassified Azospirillum TaxID=2630922 RepID=UPI003F4A0904